MQYIVILTNGGCSAHPAWQEFPESIEPHALGGWTARVNADTPQEAVARAEEMRKAKEGGKHE